MTDDKVKSLLAAVKEEICLRKFGLSHNRPSLFFTAQYLKAPAYLTWSGFWSIFFFSMLMLDIYYNKDEGGEYFIYLTNLTYMFQTGSILFDFGVTFYVNLRGNNNKGEEDKMTWYFKTLWVTFNVANTASVLVTALYYTVLSPDFSHGSVNKHLLNGVYTVLNIFFCAKPVRILHFYQPMVWTLLYSVFSIIYHLTGADPIYDPLDWEETRHTAILAILIIFVACPAVHIFIFFTLYTVRLYIFQSCCPDRMKMKPEVRGIKFESRDKNEEKDYQDDIVNKEAKY